MSVRNHRLEYRPIRGGTAIWNPLAGGVGTLGMLAQDDAGNVWGISAYHVVVRADGSLISAPEQIFQPQPQGPTSLLGESDPGRVSTGHDAAAIRILPGLQARAEVIGLGLLSQIVQPVVGMRVAKSGQETGITEGVIASVDAADRITIVKHPEFPEQYDLSNIGDSGSVWVKLDTRAPVALHVGGNNTGQERAFAVALAPILDSLSLAPFAG